MLQFGSRTFTTDGVTVFGDHADPFQFWYLPAPVSLAHRAPDDRVDFTFIKYKPAAADSTKGGGFLMFESSLRLPKQTENKINGILAGMVSGGEPRLTPAQFDEGKVRCIALDLEGAGGTAAEPAPDGAFRVVEAIHGAATPSLGGDNVAAFSLELSQEGAIIVEKAFEQGATPVGVVYDLKYTGLRPALHVEITADYSRIYNHFSAGLEGQYAWFKLGIDAGFEKLVQDGAIQIKVIDFTDANDRADKEKWALDFFKENLLSKWFEPTLTPGQEIGGGAQPEGLEDVMKRAKALAEQATGTNKTTGPTNGSAPSTDNASAADDSESDDAETSGAKPKTATAASAASAKKSAPVAGATTSAKSSAGTAAQRKPATFRITSTSPTPLPATYGMTHSPSANGVSETVRITGPAGATVTVDGESKILKSGVLALDVEPGSTHNIVANWPGTPAAVARQETFNLYFTFEYPEPPANGVFGPTNPVFRSYVANNPVNSPVRNGDASDPRFTGSTAPGETAPPGGAEALKAWLDQLPSPKAVTMTGHASFENEPRRPAAQQKEYNKALSQRRLAIAKAIADGHATVTSALAKGQDEAEAQFRADGTHNSDADDRVVKITGTVGAATQARPGVTINATISRPATPVDPTPTPSTPTPSTPKTPVKPKPKTADPVKPPVTSSSSGSGMPAAVSLKLKFLHQEERKTVKLVYDRTEAVQRSYSPQGFIGLLLDELADKKSHFIEVDLDHPFFRHFEVTVDAPIDFEEVGLISAQVAIDYGDANDAASIKHKDMIFDRNSHERQVFTTFVSPQISDGYKLGVQYHFDPNSNWEGEHLTYEIPPHMTNDRTLVLAPQELVGFMKISIFPNRVDKNFVDYTEVRLKYADPAPGGWTSEKTIIVKADSDPQLWKLRLSNPRHKEWSYQFVHHMKDGSSRIEPVVTSTSTALPVDHGFAGALNVEIIPMWQDGEVRTAFVDLHYEDPNNNYVFDDHLPIEGSQTEPIHYRIPIQDKSITKFSYKTVVIGTDNHQSRNAAEDTTDTIIGLTL